MSNTFCPIPWNFQAVQNNGTVRVCCQMNMTTGRGTLFKDDGTPYNAGKDDLDSARNAKLIKSVRKDMLQGKWPRDCVRCMQEEQSGLRSRRIYENESWNLTVEQAKEFTKGDGTIDSKKFPLVYQT